MLPANHLLYSTWSSNTNPCQWSWQNVYIGGSTITVPNTIANTASPESIGVPRDKGDMNYAIILARSSHSCSHYATRQIWGIWKLRPAYSLETPNLGQNRWGFVPCDLEIWWMTLENNSASLLCCFKLCATFHSHRWIQTGVTVRKRPIWVKFDDF